MVNRGQNDVLSKAIGQRLRQLRESKGLSQEQVLFLKDVYLTRIENGLRNISICTLIKLCEMYGVTLAEFFNGLNYESTGRKE